MTARMADPSPMALAKRNTKPVPKTNTVARQAAKNPAQARRGISTASAASAAMVDVNKPLTDKQRIFVREWASGETISTASARAGYVDGAAYAYRMVRMPNILKLYEEEKQAYRDASKITKAKIIEQFQEAYEMAKLQADPFAMVSATRETGKLLGYYEPVRRKVEVSFSNQREMTSMSNEDLQKLLDESSPAALANDLGTLIEDAIQHDEQSEEEE